MPVRLESRTASILGLFTSPGHNYFGHHGQPPGEHPIESHASIELVAGRGIRGDRFFDWKTDYRGQITLIDRSILDDLRTLSGNPLLPDSVTRRNVVVSGIPLNDLVGKRFRLGSAVLEGSGKCSPCSWMDHACGTPGAERLMHDRGGLRCRILRDATLELGSAGWEILSPPDNPFPPCSA